MHFSQCLMVHRDVSRETKLLYLKYYNRRKVISVIAISLTCSAPFFHCPLKDEKFYANTSASSIVSALSVPTDTTQ